jgi:hypothetical protein
VWLAVQLGVVPAGGGWLLGRRLFGGRRGGWLTGSQNQAGNHQNRQNPKKFVGFHHYSSLLIFEK